MSKSLRRGTSAVRSVEGEAAAWEQAGQEPPGEISIEHSPFTPLLFRRLPWTWVIGGLLVFGFFFTNTPLLILGGLLALIYLVARLWAGYSLAALQVECKLSETRLFHGEGFTLTYTLVNNKPLPLPWLVVTAEVPVGLKLADSEVQRGVQGGELRMVFSLNWYERVSRQFSAAPLPRGVYQFGRAVLTSGDLFGFFKRDQRLRREQALLVYPRIVPVEQLGLPADLFFGEFKAAARPLLTDPLRPLAVRDYAWGDSARHIHWKASARSQNLLTRVYEPVANLQLHIVLNQETHSRFWEGVNKDALEMAITVAASLAEHALEEGYQVGLAVNANTSEGQQLQGSSGRGYQLEPVYLPANRDPQQLTRILESMARLIGWGGQRQVELLEQVASRLPRGATMLLVTAVLDEQSLAVVAEVGRRGHPVAIVRVGNAGIAAAQAGAVAVYDITGEDYLALASINLAH